MAIKVNRGRKIWIDGNAVSCDLQRTEISDRVDLLDVTNFCSSGPRRIPGLADFNVSLTGFWQNSTGTQGWARPTSQGLEPVVFNKLQSKSSAIITIAETSNADSLCYLAKGCGVEINLGGRVADVLGLTAVMQGVGPLVQGKVIANGILSTASLSSGVIIDMHTVGAGRTLGLSTKADWHAAVHVFGSTGEAGHTMRLSILATSDNAATVTLATTIFRWNQGTIDNTTSPGTAKYATLKVASTKMRYVRIVRKSSAGSTNARFKMAVALGVSRRR